MEDKKTTIEIGSFWQNLTLIFITLKLCGVITWNWFWVLSPMIGGIILVIIASICVLLMRKIETGYWLG